MSGEFSEGTSEREARVEFELQGAIADMVGSIEKGSDIEQVRNNVGIFHDRCQELSEQMGEEREVWVCHAMLLGWTEIVQKKPNLFEHLDEAFQDFDQIVEQIEDDILWGKWCRTRDDLSESLKIGFANRNQNEQK